MRNLDNVSALALKAAEEGLVYNILIVRCLKTAGRFYSVRSQSPKSFVNGLIANSKSRDFGAYRSAILASMRRYGSDGHEISLHSSYRTEAQAKQAKKDLVERQALKVTGVDLNFNRPVKTSMAGVALKDNVVPTGFEWIPKAEAAAVLKAKAARKQARKSTPKIKTPEQVSA
jgi:hypothetical protein